MTALAAQGQNVTRMAHPDREPMEKTPLPIAIIGGGISGLALAAWLRREGAQVLLLEKSDRPGGVIGTVKKDGFVFERGPNTALDRSESFDELVVLAGLEHAVQRTTLKGQARYIWHGGKLHAAPTGPGSLVASGLFSLGGKVRLLREPWIEKIEKDEPLKNFVIRRLGSEAYERAFGPINSGIWASDPSMMSTAYSFPLLKELERKSGSLIKGFIRRMREARRSRSTGHPAREAHMVSFEGGLTQLPEALAQSLGEAYLTSTEVLKIDCAPGNSFRLTVNFQGQTIVIPAARVVIAAEAPCVARLIELFDTSLATRLRAIHYCPLAVIGLGVEKTSLRIPPGFGFLTARGQGPRILGAIFNSNFLPGRAPEGCAALTVMAGGDLDPDAARLADEELLDLVRRDLRTALGWNGEFRSQHIQRWSAAIPRYGMDHQQLLGESERFERGNPGITLFGNWRGGVSLGDRIDLARKMALQMAREVSRTN